MSIKVTALGTGVCYCHPKIKIMRQPPAFLIEVDGLKILFDCSEGLRTRLASVGVDIATITHTAVSHSHPDHAALPQFIQAKFCRQLFGDFNSASASLRVYLPRDLARDFPQVWNWHQPENDGGYWHEFEPAIIGMKDGFIEKLSPTVTLRAFSVYHGFGRHPAMGFRLETAYGVIAYTGDSGVCEGVRSIAQGADLLIADCSVRVGQEYTGGYGHMGPRQCGELSLMSQVKELWLTHYFDFDTSEAMLAEVRNEGFFQPSRLARDGDVWEGPASGILPRV